MRELIASISKREWKFVFLISIFLIILTGLPYVYGWLTSPKGYTYNGLHALSPGDIPVYYSYINQVKNGEFFLKDLFTSEIQEHGTFNVWWFLVGIFAKIFNLSPAMAFQLFRLMMIPIFCLIAYIFISFFLNERNQRKIAFTLLVFSSGLGIYFSVFSSGNLSDNLAYQWPIDLWLTEATVFLILYQTSHFIASLALTLMIFLLTLLACDQKRLSYVFCAGMLSLFYFNFHPYYFPVIFGSLGIYLLYLFFKTKIIPWREFTYLTIIFLISLPSIIYHLWLIKTTDVIYQRSIQNVTLAPQFIFLLIGFGVLIPGAIFGLVYLFKRKNIDNKYIFLLIWCLFNIFLVYSPVQFQSRYTQGIQVVLVIFTAIGLTNLYDTLKNKINPKIFQFLINNQALWIFVFLFS